jgi:Fic family protein
MKEKILDFLQNKDVVSTADLVWALWKDRTTIYRWLKKLVQSWEVEQIKKWNYKIKQNNAQYFDKPIWERKKVRYNPELLRSYIPNETSYFSEWSLKKLEASVADIGINTDFYKTNKKFLEALLIDLSFASSYLEWNTYSLLDTEVLLKYNEVNKQKTIEETQMVLNHKKAIEYMIFYKNELDFSKKIFYEIHTLLADWLIKKDELGTVRLHPVEIWGSSYTPIDNKAQLETEFELFLEKLNSIKNPFEQSLFIMVFIPYFQLFADVNKRTSRILWNLPLIKYNLPVLSLIQLEKKQYIIWVLWVYELNDTSFIEKIWLDNYLLNIQRYKSFF